MKRLKRFTILLLVMAMMLMCSGCGKMTAQTLAAKMAVAVAKKPMTQEKIVMEFEMSIGAQGITLNLDMDMTMDMIMSMDPYRAYTNMDMTMEMLGQSYSDSMEMYIQEEDGSMTTYSYTASADQWAKQTVELTEDMKTVDYTWLKEKAAEDLILAEETQTIGDHEVYVLSCTITGAEMQEMMSNVGSMQEALEEAGLSDFDMSALTVPMVMYIDTKTYLPVQMEMEIQGMSELMAGMMDALLGEDAASLGMEIEIGKVTAVCTDIGYDDVEVPAVPQDALDAEAIA